MFKRSIHTQEVIIEQECNKRDENPLIVKVDEKLSTTATKQKNCIDFQVGRKITVSLVVSPRVPEPCSLVDRL